MLEGQSKMYYQLFNCEGKSRLGEMAWKTEMARWLYSEERAGDKACRNPPSQAAHHYSDILFLSSGQSCVM